jgi:site-specific recombinase XerD
MLEHLPAFERSLRVLEGLGQATTDAYAGKVKEFNIWCKGNDISTDLREGTQQERRKHIEAYLEWCFYQMNNSNQTRYTKLNALSKFFRYLKYREIISYDPTEGMPRPQLSKKLMLTFTKEEVLRFFRKCDPTTEKGLRDICVLILAVFCGLRINEIITLDLNDIIDDGKDIDINVKGKQRAGRVSRQVWIWKAPGLYIRQYLLIRIGHGAHGSDPFLVSYNWSKPKGRRLTAGAVNKLIKKLAKAAGIRKAEIHAHMFRATHANDLQHVKGYTLPAIQERLGWQDLSTAGRYLVRRERIHRIYNNLHEYWFDFTKIWLKPASAGEQGGSNDGDASGGANIKERSGLA